MSISACPRCGSRKIFQGRLKEGVLTGYASKDVCRDCGYQGSPILFDSETEYQKFLEGLKQDREDVGKDIDEKEYYSEKDKQVLDYLKDEENNQIGERKSIIVKNSLSSLGFVLSIVGMLITAATYGSFIFFSGIILIPSGFILFLIGVLGPTETELKSKEKREKYVSFPKIAGILLVAVGTISLILYCLIFVIAIDPTDLSINTSRLTIDELRTLYFSVSSVEIILSIFVIIGGIFSFFKKSWAFSILGAILGTFLLLFYGISTIICLICLVLISFSRYNFNKQLQD